MVAESENGPVALPVTLACTPPLLETATLAVAEDPTATFPKSMAEGVTVMLTGSWPCPLTAKVKVVVTGDALPALVSVKVTVPDCGPTEVGAKVALKDCVPPAFTLNDAGLTANKPLLLDTVPVNASVEPLVKATDWGAEVVPVDTLPKFSEAGLRDKLSAMPVPVTATVRVRGQDGFWGSVAVMLIVPRASPAAAGANEIWTLPEGETGDTVKAPELLVAENW